MTPVGSVFHKVNIFLLVDEVGSRVVAFTPQYGMYMLKEHELIFDRTFPDEKSATEFLSNEGLKFTVCNASSSKIYCMVVPRGYTSESSHRQVFRCRVYLTFSEREPKFNTKKEAADFHRTGCRLLGLEISSEKTFQSKAEMDFFLSSEKMKTPNSKVEEETMEWPFKDKMAGYLRLVGVFVLGLLVGINGIF